MKLVTFLSATALAGLATLFGGLASANHATGLFALATMTLLSLGAVRDYAPRRPAWRPRRTAQHHPSATPFTAEPMKLAA